ncbi:MAG: EAL domain-containing protein [Coriobacteriales bacterium]|jgi:lactose/cellobiose-specific phosphotransferase system IIC component|nr:EAL domain-containing protein [Coriobacteriales bacterium]
MAATLEEMRENHLSIRSAHRAFNDAIGASASRFAENKVVRTITEGLINLIPLVLVGTICIAISNLPFPPLHDFLNGITDGHWTLISNMITFATADIIGLAALFSVSFELAESSTFVQKREISVFIPMFTAFACFVILFAWDSTTYQLATDGATPAVLFQNPGRTGVFPALFVAILAVRLFISFGRLWQRIIGTRRRIVDATFQIRIAMRSVFPVICTLVSFVILRLFVDWLQDVTLFEERLQGFLQQLITGGDFLSIIATVICMQILWFFGAHGSDTMLDFLPHVNPISQSLADTQTAETIGTTLPETMQNIGTTLASHDFYDHFVSLGGAGATMGLLIAMFVFGTAAKGRKLARISVFPIVFNVNETLIYGIPIVLNPFMLVPFLLAPMITASISYLGFVTGLVPPIMLTVEWTTPILLSGYMETGSLAGTALQFVGLAASFVLYAPFVRITKRATAKRQLEMFDRFKRIAATAANNEHASVVNRHDNMGEIAREFASEFNTYFDDSSIPFIMAYQPKSDKDGHVAGCEALLRWTHPIYGPVPPDVLIELTDEAGLSTPMGRWITKQSLEELSRWQKLGFNDLVMSINLNPHHIYEDKEFPDYLGELLRSLDIDPELVEMEITEHVAVRSSESMLKLFARIRACGVNLSIDDMGMGYSSLTYISDFGVTTVKLDISLVDKIATDVRQQEIVRSVVELATQLNLAIVVEGVEEKQQLDALVELGCRYFQGYYFSKALPPKDFLAYVERKGTVRMLPCGT